jgi:glycolate oxidase
MRNRAAEVLRELQSTLGDDVVTLDEDIRRAYSRDETEDLCFLPDAVARPWSREQVSQILSVASRERTPVTPRGAGTGLSGGALPVRGGIVLSLERLDRIRRLDRANLLVETEAGVVTGTLQREVEAHGLFYPPDPASHDRCLIGGNIAEDSAGPRSCKYGSTRRWVLGLEAVLADGRILRTGGDNRKDVAGYDLTQLLIGSEGTLAIVTAATFRLLPLPRTRITITLPFSDLESAADAVSTLFERGHDPAACEILDHRAIEATGRLQPLPDGFLGLEALLLLELDGDEEDELLERAARLGHDLSDLLDGEAMVAVEARDQRRMWRIREGVADGVKSICPYKEADTVVPRGSLAALVRAARSAATRNGLEAVCYGHAADGNLHINLLRRDLDVTEWERRRDAAELDLFEAVVALGGSVTGEHGIGWTQRRFLPLVRSEPFIDVMSGIKKAFDPFGILNPGKIFSNGNDSDSDRSPAFR